jgi:hypothetical protein
MELLRFVAIVTGGAVGENPDVRLWDQRFGGHASHLRLSQGDVAARAHAQHIRAARR